MFPIFQILRHLQIKGIRMKKFVTGFQKNVRVAILVLAQSTIQSKKVTRIKRGIFYDKGSILLQDIILIAYAPNRRVSNLRGKI